MLSSIKKLGPGLLFAGAAIGVSHLVQATKAGAGYGVGLLWALVLVCLCKYPTFLFGATYTVAAKESVLHGYRKLSKWVLIIFAMLCFASMFSIQSAVTIVTAGIAGSLFSNYLSIEIWALIILLICTAILFYGRYKTLDKIIKVVIICLSLATVVAVAYTLVKSDQVLSLTPIFPKTQVDIIFLIAFMGWMPAPLDVSVWQSLWTYKQKGNDNYTPAVAKFDFNVGYIGTFIVGLCFLLMGALLMFHSGEVFESSGIGFARQFLSMYANSFGEFAYAFIGIAACACMFSTTLTCLDASPRAMSMAFQIFAVEKIQFLKSYKFWLCVLSAGTLYILFFHVSDMGVIVKAATVISFLTAPFYAILNHVLVFSKNVPEEHQPPLWQKILSLSGILFLIGFGIWYLFVILSA